MNTTHHAVLPEIQRRGHLLGVAAQTNHMVAFIGHVVGFAWLVGASVGGNTKLFGVEMDGLGTLLLRHLGAHVA